MTESTPKPWEHAKSGGSAEDPLAARFVESLSYDRRMYKHDITGSIAHARMLKEVGLINEDELNQIESGLNEIESEIDADFDGWSGWKIELEDVHMCIEAALIEKTGDAGRKLHTGRSRNDQVALDVKLWLAEAIDECVKRVGTLQSSFLALAETDGTFAMPSYTHLQRAQPIVTGGELIAWIEAFNRCRLRMCNPLADSGEFPLGSGAIAGSSLPLDRDHTFTALEFCYVSGSSIDATANRDAVIDFVYGLSTISMWLSRWAEQWIIYASTEFSFITLDDRYTTGSSMMPQKRNPDMLELIRGRCGNVYGHLMALLTICKGLTIGYNRDLQEDKRHLFAAYDTVCDCLDMAARIVSTTKFNEEKIATGLDRGFLDATSLAEYLVTKGVPFRTSHQIVGALVRTCDERGLDQLSQLKVDDFNKACAATSGSAGVGSGDSICDNEVYDWLGAANVVKRYQTAGNAGLSGFEEQLKVWKDRLNNVDE